MQDDLSSAQTTEAVHQLVVFHLGDEAYGIDIFRVNEIIRLKEVTPVPGTQAHIRGLINLRGKTIPVMDLRLRLGMESAEETDASRIVVVNLEGESIGIIVDAVNEVLNLPESELQTPPESVTGDGTEFIWCLAQRSGRILTLLDLDQALAA
jgi:purine-binding chemotaxis protein CheW